MKFKNEQKNLLSDSKQNLLHPYLFDITGKRIIHINFQ
jgi:hypothetical protein